MTWVLTNLGRCVDLTQPYDSAAHISVAEIAHSLAQINRFTGHTVRPCSVAEHSLLVCDIAEQQLGLGVGGQMAALLHDAHECITGDVSTPLKQAVGRAWREFEGEWAQAFIKMFGLRAAWSAYAPLIHQADLIALATERRDLMPAAGPPWPSLAGVQPVQGINLRDRDGFSWLDWRTAFIDRYDELAYAIQHPSHKPS